MKAPTSGLPEGRGFQAERKAMQRLCFFFFFQWMSRNGEKGGSGKRMNQREREHHGPVQEPCMAAAEILCRAARKL